MVYLAESVNDFGEILLRHKYYSFSTMYNLKLGMIQGQYTYHAPDIFDRGRLCKK